jgi:Methylase involved in ubiquinone/menaquinone biosynthesis
MAEKFEKFFSSHAEDYRKSKSHRESPDLGILLEMVKPISEDRCLDLATGTGFTAVSLSRLCAEVIAYDGTQEMLDQEKIVANEEGATNVKFVKGNVENLHFEKESFNIVVTRRAAHHFVHKDLFLNEAFRVLKRGGMLGIADFADPETDEADYFNQLEKLSDDSHVCAEKISVWKMLVHKAGFQDVEVVEIPDVFTYDRWLNPIKDDSETGIKCRQFIESHSAEELLKMDFDRKNMQINKHRFVLTAIKPKE